LLKPECRIAQELKVATNTIEGRDSEILTLHREIAELGNGKAEIQELYVTYSLVSRLSDF
jgi:hypothetical protein